MLLLNQARISAVGSTRTTDLSTFRQPNSHLRLQKSIFSGIKGLVLVKIDGETLGDALKWEVSRNGALFPHLYGTLKPDNVEFVVDLPLGADGKHVFPPID